MKWAAYIVSATLFVTALIGGLVWLQDGAQDAAAVNCADYTLDRAAWAKNQYLQETDYDARREQAELMVRCDYLLGKDRDAVRSELGAREERMGGNRSWYFFVGVVNDFAGPGDASFLFLRFGPDGRVIAAKVV